MKRERVNRDTVNRHQLKVKAKPSLVAHQVMSLACDVFPNPAGDFQWKIDPFTSLLLTPDPSNLIPQT
jgi:hypothetical protein